MYIIGQTSGIIRNLGLKEVTRQRFTVLWSDIYNNLKIRSLSIHHQFRCLSIMTSRRPIKKTNHVINS